LIKGLWGNLLFKPKQLNVKHDCPKDSTILQQSRLRFSRIPVEHCHVSVFQVPVGLFTDLAQVPNFFGLKSNSLIVAAY
jgi:hypothetical protein